MTLRWMLAPVAVALALAASPATAQEPGRQGRGAGRGQGGVTPAEIQRLFEAYETMQAQDALHLTDAQYPQFLPRMKALQEARRRGTADRARIVANLARLTAQDGPGDEAQIRAELKALDDVDTRMRDEVRQATDALNQVLDVRQQARFRVLEEQMERRKVELLMRARRQ
jgi:Spy/CpxP family protein refolding chaperone